MAKRLLQGALAGLALLALAGCVDKKPDGPPVPVQINGATVYLSPRSPILHYYQQALCRNTVCREAGSVHLRIPNRPDFVNDSPLRTPYVQKDEIFLMAGETLSFEADEGANGPTGLRYVDKIAHPEKTLTVSLEQRSDIAGGYGMRLTVSNPFGRALKFKVTEGRPGVEGAEFAVGVCPAPPHGDTRKSWPYPLVGNAILNFSFVPTEEAEACAP